VAALRLTGAAGAGSRCTWVIAYSPMPLVDAASTGKVACPSGACPTPAFSPRYRPDVTARFSPSSFASEAGSMAAISMGNDQLTMANA
jgi:hypothetical protein